ncbi:hypothetical protein MML48_1g08749 [Holotrichia oblita]|uniref:Uncharacterized protein n=1 Tax=Holotrichia oblita TaxID=644536 RepID=A0ACB9TSK6_HOLOL|nr:hypothetical protein MML48_1g08749 [Holotrichia oblita]
MEMLNNQLDHNIDDDIPQLSAETFAALQEFYKEQEENEASSSTTKNSALNNVFEENWQLSQFWYDDKTVNDIVKIVHKTLIPHDKFALISCPTLYKPLKNKLGIHYDVPVHLYEYDTRFAIYGCDFIKYDYNSPLNIPQMYRNYYDLVIADPPFLSEECLKKTAETIKYISKDKIILCTGAIMETLAKELLSLNKAKFKPSHKNNLANEFCCFTNYDIDRLL